MQDYINININHTLLQYYILSNIQNDLVIQIYETLGQNFEKLRYVII